MNILHKERKVDVVGNGTIVADGTPEDILTDKELLESHGLELLLSILSDNR